VVTPEYEDCRRVAEEHRVPLRTVYAAVGAAAQQEQGTQDTISTANKGAA